MEVLKVPFSFSVPSHIKNKDITTKCEEHQTVCPLPAVAIAMFFK